MMKNKIYFLIGTSLIYFLTSVAGYTAETMPSPFLILPQPKNVILLKGHGLEPGNLRYLEMKGIFTRPVMGDILSQLTIGTSAEEGTLTLRLDKSITSLPSEEGYIMTVSEDRVEIVSTGEAGLFYGCQSLEQLLEDARDYRKAVPACKITDYPSLSYRAVHFDVKHHLDHMNYYYESIDRLARYKINAVVFEFEDKLRYQRQPLVGAPQAISIDEMAALTRYARERYIEITPLVQGLGHATYILKHEEYADLREIQSNRWAFCPMDEGTYRVLFDLYSDAIDATPGSKYFHIGGDEIGNIGICPRCKPVADKEGLFSLNLYWLKRVCEFMEKKNRIPIFWDDMPLKYVDVIRTTYRNNLKSSEVADAWEKAIPRLDSLLVDFPKNCIYMRWNYSMARQEGNIRTLDWYKSRGLKAMVATATNAEGGMLFESDERDKGSASTGISIIKSFIELAAEKNLNGALCTAWDDKSPHMENYWRGFITAAEYSWSPNGRSLEEYDNAYLQREFGLSIPDYQIFRNQLRQGSVLWYGAYFRKGTILSDENALQSLARLEHWLPPLAGQEKIKFDYTSKLISLPDPNSPGVWSQNYKDRIDRAQVEMNNYQYLSAKLANLQNSASRNRYYWQLARALYNFQNTAARVLLALKESDTADKNLHRMGLEHVRNAMENFEQVWAELKSVYDKTRFIKYPASYLPDRYFHLASQREDLTWMIQAEELYFGMIKKWLQN